MKCIRVMGLLAGLSLFVSVVANQKQDTKIPAIVIKKITNNTPFVLTLIDRFNKGATVSIGAGQSLALNIAIKGLEGKAINDSNVSAITSELQYYIKQTTAVMGTVSLKEVRNLKAFLTVATDSQEEHRDENLKSRQLLFSMVSQFSVTSCGWFIEGTIAEKPYYCSNPIQVNDHCSAVEVDLVLSPKYQDETNTIFNLHGECVLHNK